MLEVSSHPAERDVAEARIFTLDEAERTLPLLRRILTDLRTEYRIWQEALADYELLSGGARAEQGEGRGRAPGARPAPPAAYEAAAGGARAEQGEAEELLTSRRAVTDSAT